MANRRRGSIREDQRRKPLFHQRIPGDENLFAMGASGLRPTAARRRLHYSCCVARSSELPQGFAGFNRSGEICLLRRSQSRVLITASTLRISGRQQRLRVGLVPSQKPLLRQTVSRKLTKGNTTTLSLGRQYRQRVRNWLTLSRNAPKIPSCQSSLTSFSFSPPMVTLKAPFKRLTRARLFVSPTSCATFVCLPLLAPAGQSNCTSSSTRPMMR